MIYDYPFRGRYEVTCPFGRVGNWQCGWHIGVDIVGLDTDCVLAIADGVVESINAHGKSYGKHICIRHDDGLVSLYAHLKLIVVEVGQKVCRGDYIGIMGSTGNATGVHLHLELHRDRYKYPTKGSKAQDCPWLVDSMAWIKEHMGGEDMPEVKDLQVWEKDSGKCIIVKAVNINGSNYVRLRDIEKLAAVSVDYVDGKVWIE